MTTAKGARTKDARPMRRKKPRDNQDLRKKKPRNSEDSLAENLTRYLRSTATKNKDAEAVALGVAFSTYMRYVNGRVSSKSVSLPFLVKVAKRDGISLAALISIIGDTPNAHQEQEKGSQGYLALMKFFEPFCSESASQAALSTLAAINKQFPTEPSQNTKKARYAQHPPLWALKILEMLCLLNRGKLAHIEEAIIMELLNDKAIDPINATERLDVLLQEKVYYMRKQLKKYQDEAEEL